MPSFPGGPGNDPLTGSNGDDDISGFGGNDTLTGLAEDLIDGGADVDTAVYSEKTVGINVYLANGSDAIVRVGGLVEDTIRNVENVTGGAGGDQLMGDALGNTLLGAGGNDHFSGGLGADVLDGGDGSDLADYREKTDAIVVNSASHPMRL